MALAREGLTVNGETYRTIATALIHGRAGSIGMDRVREAFRQRQINPSDDDIATVADLLHTARITVDWPPEQGA